MTMAASTAKTLHNHIKVDQSRCFDAMITLFRRQFAPFWHRHIDAVLTPYECYHFKVDESNEAKTAEEKKKD